MAGKIQVNEMSLKIEGTQLYCDTRQPYEYYLVGEVVLYSDGTDELYHLFKPTGVLLCVGDLRRIMEHIASLNVSIAT